MSSLIFKITDVIYVDEVHELLESAHRLRRPFRLLRRVVTGEPGLACHGV